MASPPFSIAETIPADNDIVSQFPLTERTFRDVVESWLLINHNINGRHDEVQLDYKADPGSGTASVTEVWASSTGNGAGVLKQRIATGNVEYVGNPPGTVLDYAGSTTPEGYLFCYGQAVSRTTYARLFDVIGTTYGVGDASTTFNLPDARGRTVFGKDNMGGSTAGRVTSAGSGVVGTTLGASGGAQSNTIQASNVPQLPVVVTDPGHGHGFNGSGYVIWNGGGITIQAPDFGISGSQGILSNSTTGIGVTVNAGSPNSALITLPPTIILNKIIKY